MTPRESGQKGGVATRDSRITLCPLCGTPGKNQFFAGIGKKGGETAAQRAGKDGSPSMSQRGQQGGRGNTREKRICELGR